MANAVTYQKAGSKRLSIGLLVDWIENQYQLNVIDGVEDYLKDRDINLFCFEGGSLNPPYTFELHKNQLYNLVSNESIDGLIVLSASIGHYVDQSTVTRFCKQYFPIPLISVSVKLDSIPSIIIDNSSGIHELLVHLIEVHKFRNLAFIGGPKGNQDADERYRIFKDVLDSCNIPLNENLVVDGNFTAESGIDAVRTLLDERKADCDVIVATNDDMALGILDELYDRGIKVPDDLAVVGFDNLDISMFSSPPLTTVSQSMYDQGRKAAELLIDRIKGREVPDQVVLPTRLVVRESCGCLSHTSRDAAVGDIVYHDQIFELEFNANKQDIINSIISRMGDYPFLFRNTDMNAIVGELLDSFYSAIINNQAVICLQSWNRLLCNVLWNRNDVFSWHAVLSEIRRYTLPYISQVKTLTFAEDMFHQVRVMISEKVLLEEKFRHHASVLETQSLNYLRENLLVTLDERQLMDVLAVRLPEVGITSCYLSLFIGIKANGTDTSRLVLAYNEKGRIDIGITGMQFKSTQLIPADILPADRRHTMVVMSLNLTHDQLGFIVMEMGPRDGKLYGGLRRIICSTLQGALLLKKVRAQAAYLKKQQQRLTRILVDLRRVMGGFIQTMALTVEMRDPYTAGHQRGVADLARAIAEELNLSQELIEGISMAGIIHDLGKIYVPSEILNKPGELKDIEFNLIKIHPEMAYDILKSIDFPWPIAAIILQHHEKLDGSGYPLGLKDSEIMKEAKILCVADIVEAMVSHRPYRPARGVDKAMEEITKNRGILYDPEVVDACLLLFKKKGFCFIK